MKSNIFEFTRDVVLNGMPSGMLATKSEIDFDIGGWQHKSYDNDNDVRNILKMKHCSSTINILEFDLSAIPNDIFKFMSENKFELLDRNAFFVYCIVIDKLIVDNSLERTMKSNSFAMDRFSTQIVVEDKSIFINDFIKNILYL